MQPCIGPRTNTGLSEGRWEPSYYKLESIIIDNVQIHVNSKNNSFSLGTYGDSNNEIPEIILKNDGSIDCPETKGTRLIQYQATPPEGSTKIYSSMKYIIVSEGQSPNSFIPEDVLVLLKDLPECAMDHVSYKTTKSDVKKAIKVYKLNADLQWYSLLDNERKNVYKYEQVILNFESIKYFDSEASFEVYKSGYLRKNFFNCLRSKVTIPAVYLIKVLEENVQDKSEYIKEVMYEMIPAYSFVFNSKESHYDAALRFLAENKTDISPVVLKSVDVEKLLDKYVN